MCSVESGMTKEQSQGRCCLWGHPLLSSWDILMYGLTPPPAPFHAQLFTRRAAAVIFGNQRLQRWCFDVELLFLAEQVGSWLNNGGIQLGW